MKARIALILSFMMLSSHAFAGCTTELNDLVEDYEFVYSKSISANQAHNGVVDRLAKGFNPDYDHISREGDKAAISATGKTTGAWSTLVDERSMLIKRYLRKNPACKSSDFEKVFSKLAPVASSNKINSKYFY